MKIAVLPGDGIGKEVTAQAVRVLKAVAGSAAVFTEAPIGGEGVKAAGVPLPPETFELAKRSDAILFGAAGLPGDELGPRHLRPGLGLLTLRRELKLYANFRPAILFPELIAASSLKPELVEGLDLVVLRELNGDIYYGTPRGISDNPAGYREGVNTMRYSEPEIERIAHVGFRTARGRRKKLCSVDKANVLETMVLWRETVARVGKEYPDVELRHLYVDAASMELLRAPRQFDVILAPNMFGDILSDAAAMLTGSIGMLPSASIGDKTAARATRACMSRCTARRRTSPAGTSPIRSPPSCRRPCCCATVSAGRRRRRRSNARYARCSRRVIAPRISFSRE